MRVRFLADDDFRGPFLKALMTVAAENHLDIDIVRVQDVGLMGAEDTTVLGHAAQDGRVVLTFDFRTMPPYAWDRINRGLPMSGLIATSRRGAMPLRT